MKVIEAKRKPNWLNIVSSLMLIGFALKAVVAITTMTYDWDIDHELYFGQQLAKGTLMYTSEYHDKLPFGTTFLALPSILSGYQSWAIQSFLLLLTGALCVFIIVQRLVIDEQLNLKNRRQKEIPLLAASTYLFLIAFMPGNISHINPLSANLALLSLALLLNSKIGLTNSPNNKEKLIYISAAVCSAMAISIRPYYATSLIASIIWIIARSQAIMKIENKHLAIEKSPKRLIRLLGKGLLIWLASVSLIGFIINAMPYLLTDQFDHFLDGIAHNAQKLNPEPVASILKAQLTGTSPLFIIGTLTLIYPVTRLVIESIKICKGKPQQNDRQKLRDIDLILGVLVPFILLELAILTRHYWPHYQQLFAPYLAIFIGLGMAHLYQDNERYFHKFKRNRVPIYVKTISIAAAAVSISSIFAVRLAGRSKLPGVAFLESIGSSHKDQYLLEELRQLKAERVARNLKSDFIFMESMFIHWSLGESRHGFPHSANLGQIAGGWWDNRTQRKRAIDYPYNKKEVCEKLLKSGPTLIFTSGGSFCLLGYSSKYKEIKKLNSNITIFERIE